MIIAITLFILFVILFIWVINSALKQSKKDWATLEDLEKRSVLVKTKHEIIALHSELVVKGNKINNSIIHARLNTVEGYLRGMYQNLIK